MDSEEAQPLVVNPELSGASSAADGALLEYLSEVGAVRNVEPGVRPDGVRGVFATRDLGAEEVACWVPKEVVLDPDSCDSTLLEIIQDEVKEMEQFDEVEARVYTRMIGLAAGFRLEKSRGRSSRFFKYIEALPSPPLTVNTFTDAERKAFKLMHGSDLRAMYSSLVDISFRCVTSRRAEALWKAQPVPTQTDMEETFFFCSFADVAHAHDSLV